MSAAQSPLKNFDAVVLGAGVIGVTTAYWLAREGKSVCVVDRQPEAGLETSFANGGQISVSHAEPWANPSAPSKILKWLFDNEAPRLFRPKFDVHQWLWIARFLIECLPQRADRNTTEIVKLALESRTRLQEIRAREGLHYDERMKGILHFYRDRRELELARHAAELMKKYGCDLRVIGTDEVVKIEPAFEDNQREIVGATYAVDDESGDAKKFTQALASVCERMGVVFLYGSQVVALDADRAASQVRSAEVRTPRGYESIKARDIVASLGSYSAPFLRPYGVALAVYPAKGYSATIPFNGANRTPVVSLADDQYKLVYSNLGDSLRVAGTAELAGYDLSLNYPRCEAILRNAKALFPRAGKFEAATFWAGLRPATPSNIPYVGRTRRYRNLWTNTGHGTLGWTLAAGSGKRIADMIGTGEGPIVA
jgi:D-amino-acid dehydrogenase